MTLRILDLAILIRLITAPETKASTEARGIGHSHSWFKYVARMFARAKQRRQLLNLSDHLLKDIGLTHEQARHEASKPFWVE